MKHNILNIIPEGKFKSQLRNFYRTWINPLNFVESLDEKGVYSYKFKNGITIGFYSKEFPDVSSVLRGYIKYYSPQSGDILIDAGSYVGVFSLYVSKLIGNSGKVYAFEPNKENYEKLLKNIELNDIQNVKIINKGLWSSNSFLDLSLDGSRSSLFSKSNKSNKIEVTSIDNFVKENNINKLDFIKMDIEGAEVEALKGLKNTLKSLKPKFAIASYHEINGVKTYHILEKLLKQEGYIAWTTFPQHLTTYAFKK